MELYISDSSKGGGSAVSSCTERAESGYILFVSIQCLVRTYEYGPMVLGRLHDEGTGDRVACCGSQDTQ